MEWVTEILENLVDPALDEVDLTGLLEEYTGRISIRDIHWHVCDDNGIELI